MQQSPLIQSLQIELEKLPSIPHALLQLLEALHDADVSFDQITEIIKKDPALTNRVMAIACSGAYYRWSHYKDFNRLIVALGLKLVKTIAINAAVQQFFSQFNIDNKGVLARFWQASLSTANIARELAHITGYQNEDEAYIAGLLHKLGELVCLVHNADDYSQRSNELFENTRHTPLFDIESQQTTMEQKFIGASSPEVGAWIIHGYDQDSLLGDAILFQREPAEQLIGAPHLLQLVNLAHKLSMIREISAEETQQSIFREVSVVFDLNQPFLEEMLAKSHSEVLDTAKGMGITISNESTIEFDNDKVQVELADNIRTIALSSSLQQIGGCRSELELIQQITQNLNILFDLSNCIFLTCDESAKQLKASYATNTGEQLLAQLNIPLAAVATLPVRALQMGVPLSSQDKKTNDKETVLDRQLCRILNTEEILCIPLLESLGDSATVRDSETKEKFGVLVAAVTKNRLGKIKREKGLLYEFSKASSESISQERRLAEQIHSAIEEEQSVQSLQIRKLVHEANNPLGVIRNYLQILSHKLSDSQDSKLQGQLEILMEEVERVGNIVLRIREAPQKKETAHDQVDINELVNRLLAIFKESLFIRAGIVDQVSLDAAIPPIKSNANTIKQIVTNLLKNAVEAMPDGGEVVVSTRAQVNYNGEQFIELRISDNGPGIPEHILKNLFNPVKSTKSGEHSGLGLSIIKNLVNDLGGTIRGSNRYHNQLASDYEKQESTGAEFIILLPRKPLSN